jgi:hypothetical protein
MKDTTKSIAPLDLPAAPASSAGHSGCGDVRRSER